MIMHTRRFLRLHQPGMTRVQVLCQVAAILVWGSRPQSAAADAATSARAEASFSAGKAALARNDYARACPLLAESVALERASGALLALAWCHEREGKLTSAFREYIEVAERSRAEQQPEREAAARAKAARLEPQLSTLTIRAEQRVNGLEVHVNGQLVDPASFGKGIPLDGGDIHVDAVAPGYQPWRTDVVVGRREDVRIVAIPELQRLPELAPPVAAPLPELAPPVAAPSPVNHHPPRARSPTPSSGLSATQWAGLGTLAAGLITAGAGGVLVLRALDKNEDSKSGCSGNLCTPDSRRDRLYARDAGNVATLSLIAAGALSVTGVVLYLSGGQDSEREPRPSARSSPPRSLAMTAWAAPNAAGGFVRGSFQ